MVFIYGGRLIGGSAAYPLYDRGPAGRARFVVVQLQLPRRIFGFLAHPMLSAEIPATHFGNYGLLDQIAALRVVGRQHRGVWAGIQRA